MEVFERTLEENVVAMQELLNHNRMTRFRTEFLAMHHYDQGQIFEALTDEERQKVYQYLSPSELASIFDTIDDELDKMDSYIKEMNPNYAAAILGEMYADNAVDILNELDDLDLVKTLMQLMKPESAREISQLINYLPDTAGAIMTTEFVSVEEDFTLKEAYNHLKQAAVQAETIYYVYVVDAHRRLSGVISLRDLIINEDSRIVRDIMNTRVITVQVSDDQEEVARMVQDYNLLALPVIGFDRELLGIITVDDVIDVINDEAVSDYSGLAAVNVDKDHESPWSAAKSRLPWLITLLFLGMGTASLISQYEELIETASVLSAFVTLITGTAGNAGTQSLAVAVRKITNKSEDDKLFKTLGFEIVTGLLKGVIVGITIAIVAGLWKQNWILGGIIGVAMACAIFVANLAGSLIPKLMDRLGFDPAVASGPFISTLSDLTSVLIYFSIASAFMSYL
ncbi:TPA: magnesium transporter [Streptococcus suis]